MAIVVNDERIEDVEIEEARKLLLSQQTGGNGVPETQEDFEAFVKDSVVARTLVKQEAQRRNQKIPNQELDEKLEELKAQHGGEEQFSQHLAENNVKLRDVVRDLELQLRVDRLLDEVCQDIAEPSEEELRAHYEANKAAFEVPERIRVAHIVKHAEGNVVELHAAHEELKGVLETIRNGTPFEEMARQYSDCPDNAGDLGYFARGAMVPEFEEVVFALEKDEISGVFQTPFGVHIAKLYDRIPTQARSLDEMRDEVKQALCNERENGVIDAFTDGLRKNATVEEV